MDWMVDETGPNVNTVPGSPSAGAAAALRVRWHGDRLARWSAIALGASLPISTALDNILVGLILLGWLASAGFAAKWAAIRTRWTSFAVFAMVGLAVLGLAYTLAPATEALRPLVKPLTLLLIPMLMSLAWTAGERALAIKAFAYGMLVVLALSYGVAAGIVPSGAGTPFKGNPTNAYIFRLHITQNFLMAFAVFLYAAYAFAARRPATRVGWALASVAALVNLGYMVQGRTGYAVLLVIGLVVLWHWIGWRGAAAAVIGGAVLVAGAYTTSSAFRLRIDQVGAEWAKWRSGEKGASGGVYDRLGFYANTLRIIESRPLAGVGTAGFGAAYRAQIAGTDQVYTDNPHSQYLLTLAEHGIVGLAVLLALFYAIWRDAWRRREARDRIVLHAILAAIAVASLVNSTLLDHVETLFFAWGCGIALAGAGRDDARKS